MKRVIVDAEFDSLTPTKVWCVVCKDIDDGVSSVFRFDWPEDHDRFDRYVSSVSCWVGHNLIQFDVPNLNKLLQLGIDWEQCIDTLVVSRLVHYERPGGHSVENWSKQFGLHKKEIPVYDDPSMIDEYVERCVQDVEIQYRIYKELERFIHDPTWRSALRVEHDIAAICHDMHVNGFAFDKDQAEELLSEITDQMTELEEQIKVEVPPVLVKQTPIKLRFNKNGLPAKKTIESIGCDANIVPDAEWHRFTYEFFNPGSSKQRTAYLNSVGWSPTEKTKGHLQCERDLNRLKRLPDFRQKAKADEIARLTERLEHFKTYGWKVNEVNLDTLPPESPSAARTLAKWLTLEGRRGDLEEWLSAYDTASQRIHGRFNGIGAWSHRMSHVAPNQGNIFSNFTLDMCKGPEPTAVEEVKLRFNGLLRSLWKAEDGKWLVGTDAEGIQMRVLAHYIDDPVYTEAIVNGNKEDGTDVHSLNRAKLGQVCRSRADAKTFIYAWLLGAGVGKVAEILGCNQAQARAAMDNFINTTPGLSELKRDRIPADARRGYFIGLDGRKVICKYERLFITGYLQNGEAVVMKHANVLWRKWAEEEGIDYKQIDFVHDEWVCECPTYEEAVALGVLQVRAIETVGEELDLNCKLAGESKIGSTWLDVH